MTYTITFDERTFATYGADLDFALQLPVDWMADAMDAEQSAVTRGGALIPLAVLRAPDALAVFTVSACMAFAKGTVNEWAALLCEQQDLYAGDLRAERIGTMDGVSGESLLRSEEGNTTVRFAVAEDGGRLLHVSLRAPEAVAGAYLSMWTFALSSFTLSAPRGQRARVFPPADAWWERALAFERANRTDDAELVIRNAVPHLSFASQTAELYAVRMRRLQAAGEHDAASIAFNAAKRWITFYASLATSGGEGAALSVERDQFLTALRAEHHG